MPRPAKQPMRKPNPLKDRPPIKAPPPLIRQAAAGAAAAAQAAARPAKRACPNKECSAPDIQDGICHNCGFVVDDSNIVSEVQFGESSNGAAVVQGSFVSADQGTARSLGPAFRRAGGGEDRESTVREGRRIMQALSAQLGIPEPTVVSGLQIFKLAAMNNFIQGRRMDMVSAVCLYSACRKEKPCRVMLIDFADKVQVNVFKLGHTFKQLHAAITIAKEGIQPVLPEDLIYRFAMKLEFGISTNKVAEDAVRMVQRMSLDWMVMGRRPSGVCGACLILAARMNNFRRTITEVVYIVKVTTHTIQKRLEEFKQTPSSALTVEEFLHNEFLESSHDPPSFYEKTEEFQKTKKRRRKRRGYDGAEEDEENSGSESGSPNKRSKTATPTPTPDADQPVQSVELRRDADGFAIPPQPTQSHDIPIDPSLVDDAIEDQSGTSFEKLVAEFGDGYIPDEADNEDEDTTIQRSAVPKLRRGPRSQDVHVPEVWTGVEEEMEAEINEMISDPNTIYHATSYAKARRRAAAHMLMAEQNNPSKNISMDVHIGEDEFADDPEVQNCMLTPADVAKKEKVWVNENKAWLRKQQMKMWQKKQAENGPPKAKRNRKKKPRIGEGQTSAASSPGEAAVNVLKQRAFSRKINYDAIAGMFEGLHKLTDSNALGSAGTSRVTSRAGSELGTSVDSGSRASSAAPSAAGESDAGASDISSMVPTESIPLFGRIGPRPRSRRKPKPAAETAPAPQSQSKPEEEDDEEGDEDDYVQPTPAPAPVEEEEDDEDDWKSSLKKPKNSDGGDEEVGFDDDEEEYEDFGGIEPGGFGDDDDTAFGEHTGYGEEDEVEEFE